MALLARTFRTIVGLPWRSFDLLDQAMRWSAIPEIMEAPTSQKWADDLFTPCSTKCWLSPKFSYDDDTDSSGSEISYESDLYDEDDDEEWSCSENEEELDGLSFGGDGYVDCWGDRWFWNPGYDDEGGSDLMELSDAETSSYVVERLVDYVMPTMAFSTEAAIDVWIEKYGSSALQVRFLTVVLSEPTTIDTSAYGLQCIKTGLFVAVL
ncbi:hypothetical protein F442_14129 [Phytophthora nicotianae P10297]|uniref:Uncharacterized protein n=4 Tax=Phytophthora nicotianae TaxID=4792 RepID=W2PXF6_PHYN3|nr:hypothetical protein PPTG_14673 [Phytophthora nicotianae INRA-310]ETM40257.1 hypothetical protein L914_13743 [Phytophthora nicotianae]ETN04939.1 hypothetical protein PPTG_14673 [Phytophthora nicotianae INRA-310]ETP38186.1 hypothetical protein F442_14129 [Phytophthora nicotianae P10297]